MKYYYNKLDDKLKSICDKIVKQLKNYNNIIMIHKNISAPEISKVMDVIDMDFPEIFFIDIKFNSYQIIDFGFVKKIKILFLYDIQQIRNIECKVNLIAENICSSLFFSKPVKQKERIIHDFLVEKVKYNYNSINIENHTIVGALLKNSAVCEGYSKAFKFLCEKAGIDCLVVFGKANNQFNSMESHSWNMVHLNSNNYAHVDVTWNGLDKEFINLPIHYNLSDEMLGQDHVWDKYLVPSCSKDMSEIVHIKSAKELSKYFEECLKNNIYCFQFYVNHIFATTKELCSLIEKILSSISIFNDIHYIVKYNKFNGIVNIKIEKY